MTDYSEFFKKHKRFRNDPILLRIICDTIEFVRGEVCLRKGHDEFEEDFSETMVLLVPFIIAYISSLIELSSEGPEYMINSFEDTISKFINVRLKSDENTEYCGSASGG